MITRLTLPGEIEGCYNGSFSPLSSDNGIETVMNGFGDLKQVLISSVVSRRVLYVCMEANFEVEPNGQGWWYYFLLIRSPHLVYLPFPTL